VRGLGTFLIFRRLWAGQGLQQEIRSILWEMEL